MDSSGTPKRGIMLPMLVIALGAGWLLIELGVLPQVNWAWVFLLGGAGIAVLIAAPLDQITIIVGPFLIIASVMSILRQLGRLSAEVEVPALVIVVGVLMLSGRLLRLPEPSRRNENTEGA